MRIILLEDVKKIGSKYEVKEVSDGYARNFLIPKGLAKVATEDSLEWADNMLALEEEKATKQLEKVGDSAKEMDGLEVEILVKIGDKGQLFKKIDKKDITTKLKEMGYDIDKKQVILDEPIEDLGEHEVKIKFDHNLETQIKIIVSGE